MAGKWPWLPLLLSLVDNFHPKQICCLRWTERFATLSQVSCVCKSGLLDRIVRYNLKVQKTFLNAGALYTWAMYALKW